MFEVWIEIWILNLNFEFWIETLKKIILTDILWLGLEEVNSQHAWIGLEFSFLRLQFIYTRNRILLINGFLNILSVLPNKIRRQIKKRIIKDI